MQDSKSGAGKKAQKSGSFAQIRKKAVATPAIKVKKVAAPKYFLTIRLMVLIEGKLGAELAKPRPGPTGKLSDLEAPTIMSFGGLVEQHQSLRVLLGYQVGKVLTGGVG